MGELMADHHSNPELIRNGGCEGIKEKAGLSVGGQTPVLHRTRLKVWDGYQIWERENTGQGTESDGVKRGKLPEQLNKGYPVWVEDIGCWNTPRRSPAFWQQPPGRSWFAATSQGWHRWTPINTQQCIKTQQKCVPEMVILLARNEDIEISSGRPHLDPRRWCCGDGFEVTDDKSYEVRAHLYTCIKLVLKQAFVYLNRFDLKCTKDSL